jgi:predicted MFS family arabinose efflux permease
VSIAEQHETHGPRGFGGVLRQRNFRLLWAGESVSEIGNAMAVVGVPLVTVAVLHASTFAVATLTAAAYLPWLIIGLPAGAWVDRLPGRPLMIACDVVSALLYASLPAAAWLHILTIGQVIVVVLLAGAANVFFATAYQVYLPSLVTPAELVEGNAKLQGGAQVASIGGRGLAGLAAEAIGAAPALLFNSASFLVSAACLLRIRPPAKPAAPDPPAEPPRRGRLHEQTWEGIRFVARDPYLRFFTIYAAVSNLAYAGNLALVVVFLVRVVGLSSAAVGALTATSGLGGLLGALVARRLTRVFGTARTLLLTTLGSGLSGLLIPLTAKGPRIACYVAGSALVAGGIVIGNVILGSFRQAYCPPAMLGRVTASMRFLTFGAIPLGALLAGALGTVLGIRNGLWAVLAIFAASGLFLLSRDIRTARDLPLTPSAPAASARQPEYRR